MGRDGTGWRRVGLLCVLALAVVRLGTVGVGPAPGGTAQEQEHLSPVVFVVAFPSYGTPLRDYDAMTRELIADLANATRYHGYADPDAPPFLRYRLHDDRVVVDPTPPRVLANGNADYADVFDRHALCDRIDRGAVDEVWFIVAGDGNGTTLGHMPEWVTNGPGWSASRFHGTTLAANVPDCGRVVTTMMFHYGLDLGFALHSFAHRAEGFFMTHVPCDFITESWPWRGRDLGWRDDCPEQDGDRLAFVARAGEANGHVAACGDVHAPPNRFTDQPYVYHDRTPARSTCADWSMDGSARVQTVTCETWGCSQHGYMTWWMQNVPGLDNTNRDRAGRPMPNWWPLLFRGPAVELPPTPTPGPSPVPRLLFQDAFDGGRDPRWSDWVRPPGAAAWAVEDGALVASALGVEAISHVADLACTDCAVEATVTLARDGTEHDERAVGLVLRMRDPGDLILAHVRLGKPAGFDNLPSASLWRRRDYAWSPMGERAAALEADRPVRLRLEAAGEWITFSVDGDVRLVARDRSDPRPGTAGLRASQAVGHFDDVAVWGLDHLRPTPTAPPSATPDEAVRNHLPVALSRSGPLPALRAAFLGQDGGGYVGPDCTRESAPDDIHIVVDVPATYGVPTGFQVSDEAGRGLWVSPCNDVNWWLWPVRDPLDARRWHLYLEPHRRAPAGTRYDVQVALPDGSRAGTWVLGGPVSP